MMGNFLVALNELVQKLGAANKALSTVNGRRLVKDRLIASDKTEAASTLDDLEEILDAASEVGAEME